LAQLKVKEITFDDIDGIFDSITKSGHPYGANRVVALLSKMFNLAINKGWRTDNPAKGIERNEGHKRERYLSDHERARLTKTLDAWPDQHTANAIRLLLYTGARRGEVLSAEWKHFDTDKGTWTKPSAHTKTKRTHTVPLSRERLAVLSKMRALADARA
jgi:integrase